MNTFELTEELRVAFFEKLNTYLVIGAFDGISHDDVFWKINGKTNRDSVKIILVEPIPPYYQKLVGYKSELHIPQDNIFFENSAVGDKSGFITMTYFNPDSTSTKPWYIEGCACVLENDIPLNRHIKEEIASEDLLKINIRALTVPDILQKYNFPKVDYLQIDTEGYDQRIVESLDLEALGIKYLKFEAYYCTKEFVEQIAKKADESGYLFYRDRGEEGDIHIVKKELFENNSLTNVEALQENTSHESSVIAENTENTSEFQVLLHSSEELLLAWTGRSYVHEIEGKKYYLTFLNNEQKSNAVISKLLGERKKK